MTIYRALRNQYHQPSQATTQLMCMCVYVHLVNKQKDTRLVLCTLVFGHLLWIDENDAVVTRLQCPLVFEFYFILLLIHSEYVLLCMCVCVYNSNMINTISQNSQITKTSGNNPD